MPRALRVWEIMMLRRLIVRAPAASLFSRVWKVRKHRDDCYRAISIQNPLSFRSFSHARSAEGCDKRNTLSNRDHWWRTRTDRKNHLLDATNNELLSESRWILNRFYEEALEESYSVFNEKYFRYSMKLFVFRKLIKNWSEGTILWVN